MTGASCPSRLQHSLVFLHSRLSCTVFCSWQHRTVQALLSSRPQSHPHHQDSYIKPCTLPSMAALHYHLQCQLHRPHHNRLQLPKQSWQHQQQRQHHLHHCSTKV